MRALISSFLAPGAARLPGCALALVLAGTTPSAFAGSGIFKDYVVVDTGGGNTFYNLHGGTGTNWNGLSLGNLNAASGTLKLNGYEVNTFQNSGDDIGSAAGHYAVYKQGSNPGSFSNDNVLYNSGNGNPNKLWQTTGQNTNLLAGPLDAGATYNVAVYTTAGGDNNGNSFTIFSNNNGANYVASFTVAVSNFSFTGTGSTATAANWSTGRAPGTGHNLSFDTTGTATITNTLSAANSFAIGSTAGALTINGSGISVATTISNASAASQTVSVALAGSASLNQAGTGTLTLTNNNSFAGTTTISNGKLAAAVTGALGSTASITVNGGGTLLLSGSGNLDRVNNNAAISLAGGTLARDTNAGNEGMGANRVGATVVPPVTGVSPASSIGLGALTLNATSTLDFGTGAMGTLTFAGLSFSTAGLTLNVLNFDAGPITVGTSVSDGAYDRLIFAQDQSSNLSRISFNGVGAQQIALDTGYYEIVPVPEPGTVAAGLLAFGTLGLSQRRRLHRWLGAARLMKKAA